MKRSTPLKPRSGLPPLRSERLLDQVRERVRYPHYSIRTEQAYVHWVRAFIRFHGLRHPAEMGAVEVEAFLSWLAGERRVAVATHRQALSAIVWQSDRVAGTAGVQMPDALERKFPRAGASWSWFWVFPQAERAVDPRTGIERRHHALDQSFQRAFRRALVAARIDKPAAPHTLRHSFATHLLRPATTSAPSRRCSATPMSTRP
jgi:hypothetical protein